MGVDSKDNKDEGAGDQGIMFGYACKKTEELMPAPIHFSHKILRLMAEDRKNLNGIEPDSKSQVTMLYENDKPSKVTSVVISTQHSKDLNQEKVKDLIIPYIKKSIPEKYIKNLDAKEIYINPTGQFIIGGPDGDTGLTGRKIIVDTYGGAAPHGGGAFSGKDPTKVDRSAAYAARYLAKNIVASGISDKCLIQLAYAIGVSKPLSIFLNYLMVMKIKLKMLKRLLIKILIYRQEVLGNVQSLITLYTKLLLLMVILEENLQIKVNLAGKKQIKQIYLNCNLEKTIIFN